MVYLLKVTLAWAVFLLLFEVFYKANGKFTANRFYLLFSITAGLLLPLIPIPSSVPTSIATQAFTHPVLNFAPTVAVPVINAANTPTTVESSIDIWSVLRIIYVIGLMFLILKFLLEVTRIARLIIHNPYQIVAGHKVIITSKNHAPYSFMGWIFIDDVNAYQPAELAYIVLHEAAHNNRKHWLDLILLQFTCIALWFHPLIWRYRYLLQLQHEYEADHLAARNDTYAYGHFLLQQTLLNGVPSIAHSFHFSPIKNRIKMLTKKQNQKAGSWKYILLAPTLLCCTLLMAKTLPNTERIKQGDVTIFSGNEFKWHPTNTSTWAQQSPADVKLQAIYQMNGEPVYQNETLNDQAVFDGDKKGENGVFVAYIQKRFAAARKNFPDKETGVNISNIVIDKEGRIVYYDLQSYRPFPKNKYWHPYGNQDPVLNRIMDKIIAESPRWKPATKDGKPVISFIHNEGGC